MTGEWAPEMMSGARNRSRGGGLAGQQVRGPLGRRPLGPACNLPFAIYHFDLPRCMSPGMPGPGQPGPDEECEPNKGGLR